jgi:zinc finger SWIM domain-containing protein 3
MTAKSTFPPIRKSDMYDSCQSLEKYSELQNLSHEASSKAAQSDESYMHLKEVLTQIVGRYDPSSAQINNVRYGPELPQAVHAEVPNEEKILDPIPVKPRGAPKKGKRIEAFTKNPRTVTCSQCKGTGHNIRTCPKLKELVNPVSNISMINRVYEIR